MEVSVLFNVRLMTTYINPVFGTSTTNKACLSSSTLGFIAFILNLSTDPVGC